MNKNGKIKIGLVALFVVVSLFILVQVSLINSKELNQFNNTLTSENLTFTGNENITRYLSIPKNSNITSAIMNISNINEFGNFTGDNYSLSYSPYGITTNGTYIWVVNSDGATDSVYKYWMNGTYTEENFDSYPLGSSNPYGITTNGTYIWVLDSSNQKVYKSLVDGTYIGIDFTASTVNLPACITQNGTYFWITDVNQQKILKYWMNGTYIENFSTSSLMHGISIDGDYFWFSELNGNKIHKYWINGTSTGISFNLNFHPRDITQNGTYFWITDSNNAILKYWQNDVGTLNNFIELNNTKIWNHTGEFNSTFSPNKTNDFSSVLNSALNGGNCDCSGCSISGDNCTIPVIFHSDTAGILQYSNLNITYDYTVNITIGGDLIDGKNLSSGINIPLNFTNNTILDTCLWWVNNSQNNTIAGCVNTTINLSDGDYNLTLWVNDTNGFFGTDTVSFRVDSTASSINETSPAIIPANESYTNNPNVNFTANLTDNLGIKNSTLYLYNSTGDLQNPYYLCYQEHVNISNQQGTDDDCRQEYTGSYQFIGTSGNGQPGYVYLNYTKPSDSVGAIWKVDHGNSTDNLYNVSIPESCWNYNSTHLILRAYSSYSGTSTKSNGQCFNGTWNIITNDYSAGSPSGYSCPFHDKNIIIDGLWNNEGASWNGFSNNWDSCTALGNIKSTWTEEAIYWNISYTSNEDSNSVLSSVKTWFADLTDDVYTWFIKVFDWSGNSYSSDNYTLTTDSIYPQISILYPENITYYTQINQLNYSASDTNPEFCWFSNDSGATNYSVQTFGNNFTIVGGINGLNNYTVFCNDSASNVNSSIVYFTLENLDLTILYPTNNSNLSNQIFYLNFTNNSILDICYYSINGAENVTIENCVNKSLNLANGDYNLTLWANTTYNSIDTDLVYFRVDSQDPNITSLSPENNIYNSTNEINFTTNLTDNIGIKNASLYIYNGSDILNSTNTTSYTDSTTTNTIFTNVVTLVDGVYKWFVELFDWSGNSYNSDNRTLTIDTTTPFVNITYPINTTYYTPVTQLNYTYSDVNPNLCWYSINNGVTNSTKVTAGNNFTGLTASIGLNHWIVYCDDLSSRLNQSEVYFDYQGIVVNLQNPSNATTSTNLTQTYGSSATTYVGVLTNSTLKIWNSTSLIYNYTSLKTGTTNTTNITYTLPRHDDYVWNYEYCNNESTCVSNATNFTVPIYSNILSVTNLTNYPTTNVFGGYTTLSSYVTEGDNTYLIWCNYTLTDPYGNELIDNVNGTRDGNIWNSSTVLINSSGTWVASLSCLNDRGMTTTRTSNINAYYNLTYNPTNYTFGALQEKNETNFINISLFDDNNNSINYSITALIEQSGNFTLTPSVNYIILNTTDSESNKIPIYVSINASNDIGNGSYSGNITLTNSTFNLSYIIPFIYGINPPSGHPAIYDTSGNLYCTNDINSICANAVTFQQGGSSQHSYKIFNDGFFAVSGCNAKLSNDFENETFYNFSLSDFSLTVGQGTYITLTITTTTSTTPNDYRGYLFIDCDSSNLLGDNVTTNPANRPYVRLALTEKPSFPPTGGSGGGGGGAGGVTKVEVVSIILPDGFQDLTDLERAIIYARISNVTDGRILTNDEKVDLRTTLADEGIYLNFDEINLLLEQFYNDEIDNIQVTEQDADLYDLVVSRIILEESEFKVNPRTIISTTTICAEEGKENIVSKEVTSNRIFESCQVISGNFICEVTPTLATIKYEIKQPDFTFMTLEGEVKFFSEDGKVDRTAISSWNVINRCAKVDVGLFKINIILFSLILLLLLLILLLIIYRKLKGKKQKNKKFSLNEMLK